MRDQVNEPMDRRGFLGRSALGAGLVVAARLGIQNSAAASAVNPFALDLTRVSKTDPALVRYEEVGRFGCADKGARRISLSPGGEIYVAASRGVSVYEKSGHLVRQFNTASPAQCVAVDAAARVFVGLRDHVEVFDSAGALERSWPQLNSRSWLTGIAVTKDRVFLADSGNRVVLSCDQQGNVMGRIGLKDQARSIPGLSAPSPYLDVKLGSDGLLRVNNFGRHRVEAYTLDGDLEQSWGKPGAGISGFCGCCNPVSFALLPGGDYVTCEKGLPRVKVYSGSGEFVSVVAGVESFPEHARVRDASAGKLDATADDAGAIYVLDPVGSTVRVYKTKVA